MIHIGLCADERFSLPLGVCVTSIFMSNTMNRVFIHILTPGLSQETLIRLEKTASEYNQTLKVYQIDQSLFDKYPLSEYFPQAIYFRYLLPEIIPIEINKVLYLDSDTIVIKDLKPLWDFDITRYPIAAAQDANGDDIYNRNRIEIFDGKYLNSGVLLMNLDIWRKENCFSKLASYIQEFPERCEFPDQDALNVIFHKRTKWLSFRYNFQSVLSEDFSQYRLHKSNNEDICDSFGQIVILHYSSCMVKPWIRDVSHPLTFIWRSIYEQSLWKDIRLKPQYDFFRRYIKKKLHLKPYYPQAKLNPIFNEIIKQYFIKQNARRCH